MGYKILKMGDVYTINRVEKNAYNGGIEYVPSRPVRYYKTKAGAVRAALKRKMRLVK
jgi:hypothetical protein